MKPLLPSLCSLMLLVAVPVAARGKFLTNVRNAAKTTAIAKSSSVAAETPLSSKKAQAAYDAVSAAYKQGKISADSVVNMALYHKVWSPQLAEHCLRLVANPANPRAQAELGLLYTFFETAYLFPGHAAEGVALLQSAAKAGNNDANDYLGVYYHLNNDFAKAKSYFDAAGGRHNPIGLTIIGGMYEDGAGYRKDLAKSREYYRQAAASGYPNGISKYGYSLQKVKFGSVDYPEAFFWLYIAGDLGNDAARSNLWLPLKGQRYGDDFHTMLAQRSLALAESSRQGSFSGEPLYKQGFLPGLKAKEQAAERGDDWARFYLGSMNYNDDFLNRNYARALYYYEPIAANAKLPAPVLALVNERLGEMYRQGKGVKKDAAKAARYTRAAARYGSLPAYKIIENITD